MVTVINRPPHWTEALATGLGSGLNELAQQKVHRMQQRQSLDALRSAGLSEQDASLLSRYSPEIQAKMLGQLWQRGPGMPNMQEVLGAGKEAGQVAPQQQEQMQSSFYRLPLEEQRKQEEMQLKKERVAVQENTPFLKDLKSSSQAANTINSLVDEALNIINSNPNNIQYGTFKSLIPSRLQNAPTQALASILNQIVLQKAQLGKGVPSRMRLMLEEASKPAIWQKPAAVKYLLNNIKQSIQEPINFENIKDQIINENKGIQPRGLENLTKKRFAQIKGLPNASDYSEDAIIEVKGKQFARSGNSWIPLG